MRYTKGAVRPWSLKTFYIRAAILLAFLSVFLFRLHATLEAEQVQELTQFAGETVQVAGVVTEEPERRETSLHVYLAAREVGGESQTGKALVVLPRDTSVSYGDSVVVRGKISLPENFETSTGREFDYKNYLRVRGVSVLMRYADVVAIEEGGWSVTKSLYELKHAFETSIERVFIEPHASLVEGMLLGARRGIPDDLTQAFVLAGLIHVLVLSGYNISIVAEAMLRALSFLPRKYGFVVGGVMMILFALMTGAGAATVRATIMGLIAILARYLNRPAAALRALGVAAAAMVLWNPLAPVYDISFILSVIATFGLITLSPWVEKKLPKFFDRLPNIKSIAASTIAVQIFILPALLYFTGVLSFLSVFANILALPVVPLIMLLGFVAGLLGLLHPLLALLPAFGAQVLVEWILVVTTTTAALPFSATTVAAFPVWIAVAAYIPLTWFAITAYRRNAPQSFSN